jgi:hypothetical protein
MGYDDFVKDLKTLAEKHRDVTMPWQLVVPWDTWFIHQNDELGAVVGHIGRPDDEGDRQLEMRAPAFRTGRLWSMCMDGELESFPAHDIDVVAPPNILKYFDRESGMLRMSPEHLDQIVATSHLAIMQLIARSFALGLTDDLVSCVQSPPPVDFEAGAPLPENDPVDYPVPGTFWESTRTGPNAYHTVFQQLRRCSREASRNAVAEFIEVLERSDGKPPNGYMESLLHELSTFSTRGNLKLEIDPGKRFAWGATTS